MRMGNLSQLRHHCDLSLMFRNLLQHLFFHELDGDNSVLTEVVAFVDDPVVTLTQ